MKSRNDSPLMPRTVINPSVVNRLKLRIKAAAETAVRSGHPWIFSGGILESNRAGQTGELAVIFDRHDKFFAIGFFDADSPIRVRILHVGKPQTIDFNWWESRLEKSLALRRDLFDAQTTGFRLIHGESDGWPGLVLDKYNSALVLKIYMAGWLPRLDEILPLFQKNIACERIVLRLSRNIQANAEKQFQRRDGQVLFGSTPDGPVIFAENGVRFEADVVRGQKTGFFLDQRENRREVELLARGGTRSRDSRLQTAEFTRHRKTGARWNSCGRLVFCARFGGGVFRRDPSCGDEVRPKIYRIENIAASAGSSGRVQGGRVFEGDLSEICDLTFARRFALRHHRRMIQQRWLRIIPVALVMYTISYVDRTNVSLALDPKISTMMQDLLMDDRMKGEAAGIFFLGYVLLQMAGGHLAGKWSAKKLVSLCLVFWGVCAVG